MGEPPKTSGECSVYQVGALTFYELSKKLNTAPGFAGFLDPDVFEKSFGWHQTKTKRGYTAEQAADFMDGFRAARNLMDEEAKP